MRKFKVISLVALIVFIFTIPVMAAQYQDRPDIIVAVDGKVVEFPDQPPVIDAKADRILLPVRFPAETLGATVDWLDKTRQVHIVNKAHDALKDADLMLTIGDRSIIANDQTQQMDTAPIIRKDRTLVPLRFISEYLGAAVEWWDKDGVKGAFVFTKGQSKAEQDKIIHDVINAKPADQVKPGQPKLEVEPEIYVVTGSSETFYLVMGLENDREVVEQSHKYGYKFKVECTNHPEFNVRKYRVPAYGPVRYDTVRTDGWQPTVNWFLTRHDYAYTPQIRPGQVVEYRIQMKDKNDQIVRVWEGKATLTTEYREAPAPVLVKGE